MYKLQSQQQEATLVQLTEKRLQVLEENTQLEKQINRLTQEILYRRSIGADPESKNVRKGTLEHVFTEFPVAVNPRFGSKEERESSSRLSDGKLIYYQRNGLSSTEIVPE